MEDEMNETTPIPTPRTDEQIRTYGSFNRGSFQFVSPTFARQLERELTTQQASHELEMKRLREELEKSIKLTEHTNDLLRNENRMYAKASSERDQLRAELAKWHKVADELAEVVRLTDKEACQILRQQNFITEAATLHGECYKALAAYTSLTKKETP